jgi:enoyl-CoA hydratase/carnithine racemase
MLAKLTSKNQLTLPKAVVEATGNAEYFEVEARAGQLILTPVRIQRADAVRAKLAALDLGEDDLADAVAWVRDTAKSRGSAAVHEDKAAYRRTPKKPAKPSRRHKT